MVSSAKVFLTVLQRGRAEKLARSDQSKHRIKYIHLTTQMEGLVLAMAIVIAVGARRAEKLGGKDCQPGDS